VVTFISFVIFGMIPILSYIVAAAVTGLHNTAAGFDAPFIVAVILTATTLFVLGAITVFSLSLSLTHSHTFSFH
jgi:hypothetical protein